MQFISGQKLTLNQLLQADTAFQIRVQIQAPFDIDISSFGITPNDKLFHDDYMTFYNQPQTPQGEVQYKCVEQTHIFAFNLNKVNTSQTSRFVICATVANEQLSLQSIQSIQVELCNQQGKILATYRLDGSSFVQEKAVMLTEIYFKSDVWRLACIGQGFNGGLKALVQHFGGEVEDSNSQTFTEQTSTTLPVGNTSKIDLKKKIILDKVEQAAPYLIDLTKKSLISLEKKICLMSKLALL